MLCLEASEYVELEAVNNNCSVVIICKQRARINPCVVINKNNDARCDPLTLLALAAGSHWSALTRMHNASAALSDPCSADRCDSNVLTAATT